MHNGSERITTGDTTLDEMLGGGIRVGMIWEFVGEGQVAAPRTSLLGGSFLVFLAELVRHSWHCSSHFLCSSPSNKAASTAQHVTSPLPPVYQLPA